MSLSTSKSTLEQAIMRAFLDINKAGSQDGSNSNSNIQSLASSIANAIHDYVTSAQVDISSVKTTVNIGIPVSPPPAAPATTAPGSTFHTGFGKLV